MAILKIKRRTTAGAAGSPASLASGELAFNEVITDLNLYYGGGDNGSGQATSVYVIGGFGSTFDTKVRSYRLDQFAAATSPLSGVDPTLPAHLATKNYVDVTATNYAAGIDSKPSVRAIATANITLSGTQTVDGVSLVAGDRALAAGQTTTSANGVYIVASGAWTRATDADTTGEITPGSEWYVEEGTTYARTVWRCINTGTITIGTTSINITQTGAASLYTAAANGGLVLNGTAFSAVAGTNITVSSAGIALSATYAGQNTITTVGTIGTGTWQGSTIAVGYGGLGLTAAVNGLLKGNGTTTYSAAVAGTDYLGITGGTSVTTLGTIGTGVWQGSIIALTYGGTGANLSGTADGSIYKKSGTAFVVASPGTDYLAPNSTIDGGTF